MQEPDANCRAMLRSAECGILLDRQPFRLREQSTEHRVQHLRQPPRDSRTPWLLRRKQTVQCATRHSTVWMPTSYLALASFGSWHPRDMLVTRHLFHHTFSAHPCRLISERLSVEMEAEQGFSIGM